MPAYKAFAGLKNTVSPERLEEGDLVTANNVDIDATGKISRRDGRTLALAGSYHSLFASGDVCLIVGGSTLSSVKSDYTLQTLRTGLSNARMAWQKSAGRIYYSNGHDTGVIDGGLSRTWGITTPSHQGAAQEVSGALPAGAYQWAITYLRSDGQESGTGVAGRIDIANDGAGIHFSGLPVSIDIGVYEKILYMSASNGTTLYGRLIITNETTEETVIDVGDRARELDTQFLNPPPAGQCLAFHNGRMFVADGDVLYYSEPYSLELFDLRHYLPLDGRITLLAPVDGGIIVGTDEMTGFLAGAQPEEFTLTVRNADAAIPGTLAWVSGRNIGDGALGETEVPIWLASSGVCIGTPDGQVRNLTAARFLMDESGTGAALYMPDQARYLAVVNR